MINKKLLSFDRGALRYVELNVLFQWLGMLCNVVFVKAVAGLIGAAFAGSLTSALPDRIFTGEYERLFGSDAEKTETEKAQ